MSELRFALRSLFKRPLFAAVAVLTLALGIGANTAIFTLTHSIVLNPLPYEDPERLVSLWHTYPNLPRASVSPPNFRDYALEDGIFAAVSAYSAQDFTQTDRETPFRVSALRVTDRFFELLAVPPKLGRGFQPEEGRPGGERVAVLSHGYWRDRLGEDPQVLGSEIELDGIRYQVVGVMPSRFRFSIGPDLYVPLAFTPQQLADNQRGREYLAVVARLQQGMSLAQARSAIEATARRIDAEFGRGSFSVGLTPLIDDVLGSTTRPALFLLLASVGFVLLIACVNIANLFFARAERRRREFAVRSALGAGRLRIVRQFLTESLVLGAIGGAAGIALAYLGVSVALSTGIELPRSQEVSVGGAVLAFTLGISLLAGLLFGIGPALAMARQEPLQGLHGAGRGGIGGRRSARSRSFLVAAEVSLSIVLLTGGGLMMRSFLKLVDVDPGWNPDNVLSLTVTLGRSTHPQGSDRSEFFQSAVAGIEALPGVSSAGAIMPTPITGGNWSGSFRVEGVVYDRSGPTPNTKMRYVTPGYFGTLGIPLQSGRTFAWSDRSDSLPVAVVDQTFVRRYIPAGEEALGKRIGFPGQWRTIVGVVGDVQDQRLGSEINGHIYMVHAQNPLDSMTLMVKSNLDDAALTQSVLSEIRRIDPAQAPFDVRTMRDRLSASVADTRLVAWLLGAFALSALALAVIGIYGVLAFSVSQRSGELGVRSALGAGRGALMRLVLWQGMAPTLAGIGLGLAAAFPLSRLIQDQLFQVSPADPAVFIAVPIVIALVSLAACWLPARRVLGIDPVSALRSE